MSSPAADVIPGPRPGTGGALATVEAAPPPATHVDALVLDASLRQSLVTVRSLGRRGCSVAALETCSDVPAFASRWCRQEFVSGTGHATEAYLDCLEQALARTGARVLVASHDGTIALLRRHRARLEQRARVALAGEPALAVAVNKERTLAVAARLGIAVPPSVLVRGPGEVDRAVATIGLPAVIKPVESWVGGKTQGVRVASHLVITPEEAQRAVATLARLGGATLLQPLLTGRREAVSCLYANGEMYARFAQWAKRTGPPLGGESVVRQSIAVPDDIGSHAEQLVRALDLEGYSEVEFRRDGAGVPYLMEINPRLSASVELAVRAGVDFPYLLYQWARGGPIDRIGHYRVGGWMRHLKGDIMTTIAMLGQRGRPGVPRPVRAILDFGVCFLQPMGYDYVDWRDPLPALMATAGFTRIALRKLMRRNPS
jgi:predicted ATP-grasp superfamily ATP-dependent carboligase